MRKQIEAFFLGGQWRRDEHAWRVWQGIEPMVPARFPMSGETMPMAGHVVRIYQRAYRGSKALVDFGAALGVQDTWWEQMRPPVGKWVVLHVHLWLPPGTHSEQHVLWVDHWESWAPGDVRLRAMRHQRRLDRESGEPPIWLKAASSRPRHRLRPMRRLQGVECGREESNLHVP